MDSPLGGTGITGTLIQNALAGRIPTAASNLCAVSAECNGLSKGLLSEVLRVELKWKEMTGDVPLPTHVVVKTTGSEKLSRLMKHDNLSASEEQATKAAMELFHNTECAVYDLFNSDPPGIPIAECYSVIPIGEANKPPMIVLQDLHAYGRLQPIEEGLTVDQLFETADKLAKLHAWSVTTKCRWKEKVQPFEVFCAIVWKEIEHFIDVTADRIKKETGKLDRIDFNKIKLLMNDKETMEKLTTCFRSIMPDVIAHGDLWANNLIFSTDKKTGEASPHLIAIIDWQMCHQGPFTEDLANMLGCSVDVKIRQNYTKTVFRRYFVTLSELLPDEVKLPSFEEAYIQFRTYLAYHYVVTCCSDAVSIWNMDASSEVKDRLFNRIATSYEESAAYLHL